MSFLCSAFEDTMLSIVSKVNSFLADYILIILLVGVGLFYTIRTKFVQVRCFGEGMKNVFGKIKLNGKKNKSGMSSFQAFATAVAAQVGTGNIIGASGAILVGGPGAIFWMWIIAFLGMATIYSEAVLAQKTRELAPDGQILGGPVYYMKKAFPNKFGKFLGIFFAVACIIALGFIGSMVQANSISESVQNVFTAVDPTVIKVVVAVILATVAGFIFIGGISRLASVTEKLVPIMAIVYIIGSLVIIGARIQYIPETFAMIFKFAFVPQAVIGGAVGSAIKMAISQGAKRGLFSNEAGMGSTPHAHAQANVKTAHEQGTVAMVGVFIDTFIVLTFTALVVISTLYAGNGQLLLENGNPNALNKSQLVANAFAVAFGGGNVALTIGSIFVAVCLLFFAFSTIISWNMFGKVNFTYLFKGKGLIVYSIISIAFIVLGAFMKNDLVWELTDFFNYLMVLPNAVALFALSNMVIAEVKANAKKNKPATLDETNEDGEIQA